MPTAAAATYVRTVLFRRRHSSSCAREKGFVPLGRRHDSIAGARARLGRFHVPSRLSPFSGPAVPLHQDLRNGSTLSAALVGDTGWLQSQPQKAIRLHPGCQSPPIAPGKNARLSGPRGHISRDLLSLARSELHRLAALTTRLLRYQRATEAVMWVSSRFAFMAVRATFPSLQYLFNIL